MITWIKDFIKSFFTNEKVEVEEPKQEPRPVDGEWEEKEFKVTFTEKDHHIEYLDQKSDVIGFGTHLLYSNSHNRDCDLGVTEREFEENAPHLNLERYGELSFLAHYDSRNKRMKVLEYPLFSASKQEKTVIRHYSELLIEKEESKETSFTITRLTRKKLINLGIEGIDMAEGGKKIIKYIPEWKTEYRITEKQDKLEKKWAKGKAKRAEELQKKKDEAVAEAKKKELEDAPIKALGNFVANVLKPKTMEDMIAAKEIMAENIDEKSTEEVPLTEEKISSIVQTTEMSPEAMEQAFKNQTEKGDKDE